MNSINWPALLVWVFLVRLVEHCSANAEATGLNPVEGPKTFFFWEGGGLLCNCLNCNRHNFISFPVVIVKGTGHNYQGQAITCNF